MGMFDWLFGKKEVKAKPQPTVTVGISSDAWLDWMLDELDEKDRRKAARASSSTQGPK